MHDESLAAVERAMVAIRRRQRRRALAKEAGPHFDVLDMVEAAEESATEATVSTVASALGVDQPRASRLVAAAIDGGMLRRVADQADGRRALLVRTARGRAASERIHRTRQAAFADAMAGWTDGERAEFARLLGRFVDALGRPKA